MAGIEDNRPQQETVEVNHNSHCESPSKAKRTLKNQTSKNRSSKKRVRMKRHRPKVYDETKPIKPSTPKPRTPKRPKSVKKDSMTKIVATPFKDANEDCDKYSCRQKLDFEMENRIVNQDSKACDGVEGETVLEPKLLCSDRRFSSPLRVYERIFRPNECLKNSRKIGPNCPKMFKKRRMSRQRANVFEKFISLVSEITPQQQGRRTATKKGVSKKKITTRKKAVQLPTTEEFTLNLTWVENLKRKRLKVSTHRRDFSSFVNDLSKLELSETFLLRASNIGTQYIKYEGFQDFSTKDSAELEEIPQDNVVSCDGIVEECSIEIEVKDDWVQDLSAKEWAEETEISQENMVSCNGSVEKCDFMLGIETDLPEHNLESDMVNYPIVNGHSPVEQSTNDMGSLFDVPISDLVPHHEEKNDLDYDVLIEALVDFSTQRMESLNIDDDKFDQLVVRDLNANGELVKFYPSKRRTPIPKVDLDEETLRVWNLLMENRGSEDTEQEEDDDKAKYWRERRELYRGRVDSFIARMHLVQGDRRFSPWKGSVADSVVGVYLTQNVSDQLSSSAFMSLAARFPPGSASQHSNGDGKNECVHETQQASIIESPKSSIIEPPGKSESLLMMEEFSSSLHKDLIGEDPEIGNKTSSQNESISGKRKGKAKDKQEIPVDWDELRKQYSNGMPRNRNEHTMDSVDWEAVRQTPVEELAKVIMERGMNNILAGRIKDFLDRMVRDHGSIDLEWLRDAPPEKAKEYLLSITGLGLKSVECLRLLTLHHHAFPVDVNVGRILVRLGWVPLQPLPEDVQIHLLNQYPLVDSIQKYIWPLVCKIEQPILYELHCQMIALGKSICTKRQPNCNACPMRGECRHYSSSFASSKPRLEGSQRANASNKSSAASAQESTVNTCLPMLSYLEGDISQGEYKSQNCEPIVEIPASPEIACTEMLERDIEDFGSDSEIPTIRLNSEEFMKDMLSFMDEENGMSKALVALRPEVASIPRRKLKDVKRLRTEHHVYELPDSHPLLLGKFGKRVPDDPCPYLLAIWTTDDTTNSSQESTCDMGASCSTEIVQYQNENIVKGTILVPCRTANKGSFPLNGTYFQVNEVFADHESSRHPIDVSREWIWNLKRRPLYCGTSLTSICRGMSEAEIPPIFWEGFICIRGIDRITRAPRPLARRFHECKTRQIDND